MLHTKYNSKINKKIFICSQVLQVLMFIMYLLKQTYLTNNLTNQSHTGNI